MTVIDSAIWTEAWRLWTWTWTLICSLNFDFESHVGTGCYFVTVTVFGTCQMTTTMSLLHELCRSASGVDHDCDCENGLCLDLYPDLGLDPGHGHGPWFVPGLLTVSANGYFDEAFC